MAAKYSRADDSSDLSGRRADDDRGDPKKFFDRRRRGGRKTLQLCRQVQRALTFALSEVNDDALHELYVESVEPAPNDRRMMVTVSMMGEAHDPAEILTGLQFATPFLRNQVAASIHRKRVPELVFRCIPPETPQGA